MDLILPIAMIIVFGFGSYALYSGFPSDWSPLARLSFRVFAVAALISLILFSPDANHTPTGLVLLAALSAWWIFDARREFRASGLQGA